MARNDQISSAVLIMLGLSISYLSIEIGLGNIRHPGPGSFPFCSGILLSSISLAIFIVATMRKILSKKGKEEPPRSAIRWRNVLSILLALAIYAWIFEKLGFSISSFLLMFFLFKGIEPQKLWVALVASLLTVFISYSLFSLWLGIQFPTGILGI